MFRIPPTHLLVTLESISRLGSLSAAAKDLHLTTSAVSHRLANLESLIGTQLFVRTRNGMRPTDEGVRYSQAVRSLIQRLAGLSGNVAANSDQQLLRIQASPLFVSFWLLPRLSTFSDQNPSIRLEIVSSTENVDFQKDSVDLWILRGLSDLGELFVERLFTEHFVPLAAPAFLKRTPLKGLRDIEQLPLISCSRNSPTWSDWFMRHGLKEAKMNRSVSFSNPMNSMAYAADGAGLVLESKEFSRSYRSDGRLSEVFPGNPPLEGAGLFLVCPKTSLEFSAVRIFRSWMSNECDRWKSHSA